MPVLALRAGGEPEQGVVYKQGKYQGKPDTRPWDNEPLALGGSAEWTKGDRASRLRLLGGRRGAGLAGPVGGAPAPDLRALATAQHALAVDVGDHVAVAAKQRLGRAHFRARRKRGLGQAVAAVFLELGLALVGLGTAGAEGALVHLAAQAESAGLRELRGAERAG